MERDSRSAVLGEEAVTEEPHLASMANLQRKTKLIASSYCRHRLSLPEPFVCGSPETQYDGNAPLSTDAQGATQLD